MSKVKTTIYIPEETREALREISYKEKVSMNAIINMLLKKLLEDYAATK